MARIADLLEQRGETKAALPIHRDGSILGANRVPTWVFGAPRQTGLSRANIRRVLRQTSFD
jgi:hypothetical protein